MSMSFLRESQSPLMVLQSSSSVESTRLRSVRLLLKSVPSEAQSLTRARESSTKTRQSAARSVSPVVRNKAV